MVTKFKSYLAKENCIWRKTPRYIVCVDSTVFPQSLWRSKTKDTSTYKAGIWWRTLNRKR